MRICARLLSSARPLALLTAMVGGSSFACRGDHARFATPAASSTDAPARPALEQAEWASETMSPHWIEGGAHIAQGCAGHERALTEVARLVAERRAADVPALDMGEIAVELRARGSPHVWPRVWTYEARGSAPAAVERAFDAWLARLPAAASRRCGVGAARTASGAQITAVIVVEPLADLDPLPTAARSGQWLRFSARLSEGARAGEVVLLGPRGMPRSAPTSFAPGSARAAFSLDQPGLWRAQLLLETAGGPRPALEAWVFVDEAPRRDAASGPAPGEVEVALGSAPEAWSRSLLGMMNAARLSEQWPPLQRDERLDVLARAHAEAMRRRGQASHDTGDGSPVERVARAAYPALRVGENVAQASSLARAHRALWNSPSHRANLLDSSFDRVGVGVVVEPAAAHANDTLHDGLREAPNDSASSADCTHDPSNVGRALGHVCRVWVCQLFVDSTPVKNADSGRMSRRASRTDMPARLLLHNEE